jgi:ABC-type bacteriocin/lantibiotic exporter with double-glycine peptidase domain
MCIGAVSSFIRDALFGITSERIGRSLRTKLFDALIRKDVAFFDDNRTGDICK